MFTVTYNCMRHIQMTHSDQSTALHYKTPSCGFKCSLNLCLLNLFPYAPHPLPLRLNNSTHKHTLL